MMDNQLPLIPDEEIRHKIHVLRGLKVILDKDLAEMYGVKPTRLREQLKRNKDRFPENFMFQLTNEEVNLLVSQNAIPSRKHLGGSLPFVFTEHGVLMLANVLKSTQAIQMSIRIIEIFVKSRELLLWHQEVLLKLELMEKRLLTHDEELKVIFSYIKELLQPAEATRNPIGFKIGENKE
jgi:hypothetical protein